MSQKSGVVTLGIIPKNQNKLKKMVEILTSFYKYVPQVEYLEEYQEHQLNLKQILNHRQHGLKVFFLQ